MDEIEPIPLEHLEEQLKRYKEQDLKKKLGLAANVYKKCLLRHYLSGKCHLEKASALTGVTKQTLNHILMMNQKCKSFTDWAGTEQKKLYSHQFGYLSLRTHLIEYYTKQLIIPTGLTNMKTYTDCKEFCTSIPLPGTKKSIIVERPEMVLERHRFLYTKMKHREEDRIIVYIGKVNILAYRGKFSYKEDDEYKNRFIIAASPKLGFLSYSYCGSNSPETITKWIQDKILPELPRECVVIIQESVLGQTNVAINSYSLKEQMTKWLDSMNIPHDSKQNRAELYNLIKLHKAGNPDDVSREELVLRTAGHITMRKKKCNLDNNYFDPFWVVLMHELNTNTLQRNPTSKVNSYFDVISYTANLIIYNRPHDYWRNLEDILLEKERQMYKEDLEMEYIIDKIMTMTKNEGMSVDENLSKLDKYDKQLTNEHFILQPSACYTI